MSPIISYRVQKSVMEDETNGSSKEGWHQGGRGPPFKSLALLRPQVQCQIQVVARCNVCARH